MWGNTGPAENADEQDDDRYPFFPVDCGNPITAALCAVLVLGLIAAMFLVTP